MKSRLKGLFAVIIVLAGVIVGSIGLPDQSIAQRTDTYTGKIDFDIRMDDGSLVPAGKVPVAKVDYAVRIIDQEWRNVTNIDYNTDQYANLETITIPYNGVTGTYSATKPAQTWNYGWFLPSATPPYIMRGWTYYHLFHKLNFTTPKYIRTISAKSSVLGDYSHYTLAYDKYRSPTLGGLSTYHSTFNDNNTSITNPDLTRVAPGNFSYQVGPPFGGVPEFHPNTVEFALSGGRVTEEGVHYTDLDINNTSLGASGKKITFFMKGFEVTEIFRDENGSMLTPPGGFTQSKKTDANSDLFTHTMKTLPKFYTTGGNFYVLKGWYQGPTKPGTLNTTNPPSMTVDYTQPKTMSQLDQDGILNVVYEIRNAYSLQERYVDQSNTPLNSGSWDSSDYIDHGDNFTGTPAATKTDNSGVDWDYQGWKPSYGGTVRDKSVPVTITNVTSNQNIFYIYKKKQHTLTEKWVDQADGSTLVPLAVNPKTNSVDDNDNFTGTASATITDTGGGVWDYAGWENVTDDPGNVNPSAAYAVNNVKGGKEIRYHYKARNTTATLDLKPTPQVTDSGGTVNWSSRLTNTGSSALNNLKLKATSNWATGLSTPTKVTVTPAGGAPQDFTISPSDWVSGFNLTGINIPSGGANNYADITFTDTATGAVNQVLPAEIEVTGNMASPITAENFVRIDDQDEPNLLPSGNSGLLNIPNFKFGETEVKPFAQRKGLDPSEYTNPSYNPYIRYMDNESIGTYQLSVKMGPFTNGSKTLPNTTSIILGDGHLKEVQNYNKPNETLSGGTNIGSMRIQSDNVSSVLHLGNVQGVYQIDYDFNDVELDLPAHSGVAGLEYKAVMDWTLTTAP